jgi:hypothetical protein
MPTWTRFLFVCALAGLLGACGVPDRRNTLFTQLPADSTSITFVNDVEDTVDRHVLNFPYIYNGGGVAAGDVNNDGRPDLYFTANMGPNKLYLNEGNFQFRDVTAQAGVQDTTGWTTGVTMADVNGDGALDIYVCRAGTVGADHRRNQLYINDGDGTFTEQAAAYGLDASAYSVHASFFDYDRDGDLDLYLLNNPPIRDSRVSTQPTSRQRRTFENDQLFRNDDGTFVDVTTSSGLRHDAIGFGLSATVSDVNQDGWPDVYVANDYDVEDRLYINQQDGTFEDRIHQWTDHMARSSMGADIADYNNDGRPDIFVADMLPEDNRRQKLLNITHRPSVTENFQFQRNVLQLHNGPVDPRSGPDGGFSEIGQLAGVSNTGWSWAALFGDFDLDGHKDLFVSNGVRYDHTNMDFQFADYIPALMNASTSQQELYRLVQEMPSTPIPNYIFRNRGDLTFETASAEWGVAQKGFSNGAAYADLDGDGDLDLVVNNIDDAAWVYRNTAAETTDRHYLRVALEGTDANRFGIGATVTVTTPDGKTFFQEMMPARGFQSSVEPVLTFGLGTADTVDVSVTWPDQTQQHRSSVPADQTLTLDQGVAQPAEPAPSPPSDARLTRVSAEARGLDVTHQENSYEDYRDEALMPHMLARLGPALARGDVNGDGREDVFVGGAREQPASLFVQQADGSFTAASVDAFADHAAFEDVAATFLDVNGDGHDDLYVVSGGRSQVLAEDYQDRVYLNDGTGMLEAAPRVLPKIGSSGGTVAAHDYDGDGDPDLFVGGRVRATAYPLPPQSYLLENTGGAFEDVTDQVAPALRRPGMVTDAHWGDLTGDGRKELVLAGEWMPIRVFRHEGDGTFTERTEALGFDRSDGWWYRLALVDVDGDGALDVLGGNRGRNHQIQATPDAPASVYAADFDDDGDIEPIMSHYIDGTEYPVPRRGLLMDELSMFRVRYQSYASYADATMDDVLTADQWEMAESFRAYTFSSSVFEQQDDGTFTRRDLPVEAQFSPTRGMVVRDVNGDDRPDVLLAGNDFTRHRYWGPSDAGKGLLLINRGDFAFEVQRASTSGFYAPGDVRDLLPVSTSDASLVLVGNNDASLDLFELPPPPEEVATRF